MRTRVRVYMLIIIRRILISNSRSRAHAQAHVQCTFDMRVYTRIYWPSSCAVCAHMRAAAAQIRSIVSARVHSIYACAHVRAYMHLDLHMHVHAYIYVHVHVYVHICMHVLN
jgi:hypothetical protein